MSGYGLAQAAGRSISTFYPISKTQVYGELSRLEKFGLVRGRDVAQKRLPDKRVFELTQAGEEALDGWLGSRQREAAVFRLPSLLKVFFGHRVARERLTELLDQFLQEAESEAEHLTRLLAWLGKEPDTGHAQITALYGLRVSQAISAWAGEVKANLPPEVFMDPHRSRAPTATRIFREIPWRDKHSKATD
jgi:DNA-binding PadR family transcriptional regulator